MANIDPNVEPGECQIINKEECYNVRGAAYIRDPVRISCADPFRIGLTQSLPVRCRGPRLFRFSAPASKLARSKKKSRPGYCQVGFVTPSGHPSNHFLVDLERLAKLIAA